MGDVRVRRPRRRTGRAGAGGLDDDVGRLHRGDGEHAGLEAVELVGGLAAHQADQAERVPAWISTWAMTPSRSTRVTRPGMRLRADARDAPDLGGVDAAGELGEVGALTIQRPAAVAHCGEAVRRRSSGGRCRRSPRRQGGGPVTGTASWWDRIRCGCATGPVPRTRTAAGRPTTLPVALLGADLDEPGSVPHDPTDVPSPEDPRPQPRSRAGARHRGSRDAAARWVGFGDKNGADGAAVNAMRALVQSVSMRGVVVIGEGEKDDAPMLFNGEAVGDGTGPRGRRRRRPDRRHDAVRQGHAQRDRRARGVRRHTMYDPRPSSTWRSS